MTACDRSELVDRKARQIARETRRSTAVLEMRRKVLAVRCALARIFQVGRNKVA